MRVSEFTLLEEAFSRSFGFMLNRVWEAYDLPGDPHEDRSAGVKDLAAERCFTEFLIALEELGVELGEMDAPLKLGGK